jgi:DNA polymerase
MNQEDKQSRFNSIIATIQACKKCRLCENAIQAVPGEGNINAELVFIGEAPGEKEDLSGRPFVGRAGLLLDRLLEKIGMARSDVWIGNIVKHRPPQNRDPLPDEITACSPYLAMQLELIAPRLVVTLGRYAMSYFHPAGKISLDHGNVITLPKFTLFPVYHPAAALRNPSFAKALVKDFLLIPKILEQQKNSTERVGLTKTASSSEDGQLGLYL